MCCCNSSEDGDEIIDGVCHECGEETSDGKAIERCYYSPIICVACGDAPCDGSC